MKNREDLHNDHYTSSGSVSVSMLLHCIYLVNYACDSYVTATAVIPVSVNVVMLCVVMFLMGVTFGGLNNGK